MTEKASDGCAFQFLKNVLVHDILLSFVIDSIDDTLKIVSQKIRYILKFFTCPKLDFITIN